MKVALALCAAALLLTGCGGEEGEDAEVQQRNTGSADVINFPDGFSNVATKCDHGNRVYVIYHSDAAYGSVAVVPNAKGC